MTTDGMDALVAALREKAGAAAAAVERGLLEKAAEPIRQEAQALVNKRTGELQGKIGVSGVRRSGDSASIKIGVPRNEGVAYGTPLEWGHVNRDGSVTPPYPFMAPAYESEKGTAYTILRDGLREAVLDK